MWKRRPAIRPRSLLLTTALASLIPAGLDAQLAEACPDAEPAESALLGFVTDPQLNGMPVLGAVVVASWTIDGASGTAEGVVPDDGVYLICGLPRDVRVTVQATFSGRQGPPVEVMIREEAVRQDLTVSLAGRTADESAPLFIGPDSRGWCPDLQAPHLIECILLDDCAYTRLGRVQARKVGAGADTRELVETFVREARRLEVHAVRDIRAEYEQRGHEMVLVNLQGTGIEFTEQRCIAWVTGPIPI